MLVTDKRHLLGCVELSPRATAECYLEMDADATRVLLRHSLDLTIRDISVSDSLSREKLDEAIHALSDLQCSDISPELNIAADGRVPCDSYRRYDFNGVSYLYAWRPHEKSSLRSLTALLTDQAKPQYYVCFASDHEGVPDFHFSLVRKEKLRDLQTLLENALSSLSQ